MISFLKIESSKEQTLHNYRYSESFQVSSDQRYLINDYLENILIVCSSIIYNCFTLQDKIVVSVYGLSNKIRLLQIIISDKEYIYKLVQGCSKEINMDSNNSKTILIQKKDNVSFIDMPRDMMLIQYEFIESQLFLEYIFSNCTIQKELLEMYIKIFSNVFKEVINKFSYIKIEDIEIYDTDNIKRVYPTRNIKTIQELLNERFNGNNIAIIDEDSYHTYDELMEVSNSIASNAYINMKENIVGIVTGRSYLTIAAMFSAVFHGVTYIPLGNEWPKSRMEKIILENKIEKVLFDGGQDILIENFKDVAISLVDIRDVSLKSSSENIIYNNSIAYIIYTSGSTGEPKGVKIKYEGLANLIENMQKKVFSLNKHDVVAQFADQTFDASIVEIYMTLFSGASLCIIKKEAQKNIDELYKVFNENKVSVAIMPPSYLSCLEPDRFNYLRILMSAGELCSYNESMRWKNKCEFLNGYGPTEATVCTTFYKINEVTKYKIVPIGKAIDNVRTYVLNKRMNRCLPMMVGELYIGGAGVAKGYVNNMLNVGCFYRDIVEEKCLMYRTGDYVKILPDGNLLFLGRKDNQVKIRGYRIELEEINMALKRLSYIRDAFVTIKESNNDKELIGFVILKDFKHTNEIILDLNKIVPKYMLPDKIYQVNSFELNDSGKVNIKPLLEEIEKKQNVGQTLQNYVLSNLLLDECDLFRDIRELRINSIILIKFITSIRKEYKIKIDLKEVLKVKNINELIGLISFKTVQGANNEENEVCS